MKIKKIRIIDNQNIDMNFINLYVSEDDYIGYINMFYAKLKASGTQFHYQQELHYAMFANVFGLGHGVYLCGDKKL